MCFALPLLLGREIDGVSIWSGSEWAAGTGVRCGRRRASAPAFLIDDLLHNVPGPLDSVSHRAGEIALALNAESQPCSPPLFARWPL
jgi:hypothetical protein